MFFIESGRVQVLRGQGADTLVLAELAAGDLFGEMALLTGSPRSATVTALSDLNLWSVSQADFDDLVTTYPHLALALSRLLSERLRNTDERLLQRRVAPAPVPVQPRPAEKPVAKPRPATVPPPKIRRAPKPRRAARPRPVARPKPARNLLAELREGFNGVVAWFDGLSRGAKVRLLLVTMGLAWLVFVVAPALLISTLAADQVTNLQGAIAFVQTVTPVPSETPLPTDTPIPPTPTPVPPTPTLVPPTETAVPPTPTPVPPTDTPVPPTETPVPPTPTPVPPTATPVPPTPTPKPPPAATSPPKSSAASAPPARQLPPRELDPRLGALNVGIVDASVQPGQSFWRLVKVHWQNKEESGNDHTIYINVLDEHGGRLVGQPVEIRWQGGNLIVPTEDKPVPEYGANFPMYGTLGSYSVNMGGLPSDTIQGLGMGTPEQPAFTIHTNFLLTFQRVKR
jgi:hypothetical protein